MESWLIEENINDDRVNEPTFGLESDWKVAVKVYDSRSMKTGLKNKKVHPSELDFVNVRHSVTSEKNLSMKICFKFLFTALKNCAICNLNVM